MTDNSGQPRAGHGADAGHGRPGGTADELQHAVLEQGQPAAPGGHPDPDEAAATPAAAATGNKQTGTEHGDHELARLLHDLAVANDYHPELPMRPVAGDGG